MRQTLTWQLAALLALSPAGVAAQQARLAPLKTVALDGVKGRIDHMAADASGQRLFLAALGNGSLEVIDLAQGKVARSIPGLEEPQGMAFVPDLNRLFVACGGDGTLRIYDTRTFRQISTLKYSSDADNVRYDPVGKRIYVGYGEGAIAAVDPSSGKKLGEVALPGHPESFQLEPSGSRMYVNVPTAHLIAVIDRSKMTVEARWPLREMSANFPMALDAARHRLFVACRRPATLLVLDTETGREVAKLPSAGDADDLFYDGERKLLYLSGGEGRLDIFAQDDADHYRLAGQIATAPGARTALFIPALGLYCLAVPHREKQAAEVRIFQTH